MARPLLSLRDMDSEKEKEDEKVDCCIGCVECVGLVWMRKRDLRSERQPLVETRAMPQRALVLVELLDVFREPFSAANKYKDECWKPDGKEQGAQGLQQSQVR